MGRTPNTECDVCGTVFYKRPSDKEKTENDYCNRDCMSKHRSAKYSGDGNPNYTGAESTCKYCSSVFTVRPSRKENRVFCSKECHGSWMSENNTGENSPRWKGGWSHGYGYNWERQKEKRLEKDGYECVVCGMTNKKHKEKMEQSLHIHHIERKEKFRDEEGELDCKRANRIENLVTLCWDCHYRWEGIPLRPQ